MPVAVAENGKENKMFAHHCLFRGKLHSSYFTVSSQISLSFAFENKGMVSSPKPAEHGLDITAHCGAAHSVPGQDEQTGSTTLPERGHSPHLGSYPLCFFLLQISRMQKTHNAEARKPVLLPIKLQSITRNNWDRFHGKEPASFAHPAWLI